MKLMKILFPLMLLIPVLSESQCRSWTKSNCFPMLSGFLIHNNCASRIMSPGEDAQPTLTFYAGKQYRLAICSHPNLGNVSYEVIDMNGELIYKSDTYTSPTFDFKIENTQQLRVVVRVPENEGSVIAREGCLSVLIGYKETM